MLAAETNGDAGMRDLVVHASTSLDGYSCDEGTEMFRVMGDIEDPVGDDLFVGGWRAWHVHHGPGHLPGDGGLLAQ